MFAVEGKHGAAACYAINIEDVIGPIADAVDIVDAMKPIYNFKAS